MGKKLHILFFFGALSLFLVFTHSVQAQFLPSGSGPFENEQPTCGMANTAPTCCESKEYFSEAAKESQGALSLLPGVGSLFSGAVVGGAAIADKQLPKAFPMVSQQCFYGSPVISTDSATLGQCTCQLTAQSAPVANLHYLCDKYIIDQPKYQNDPERLKSILKEHQDCNDCADNGGYYSSLGCVPVNLSNFLSNFILQLGIGFAGMIALLCIIYSAFILQTSAGNPERIKTAQEQLTSCIVGLMMVIFSVFIIRLIGIDILRMPGFLGK